MADPFKRAATWKVCYSLHDLIKVNRSGFFARSLKIPWKVLQTIVWLEMIHRSSVTYRVDRSTLGRHRVRAVSSNHAETQTWSMPNAVQRQPIFHSTNFRHFTKLLVLPAQDNNLKHMTFLRPFGAKYRSRVYTVVLEIDGTKTCGVSQTNEPCFRSANNFTRLSYFQVGDSWFNQDASCHGISRNSDWSSWIWENCRIDSVWPKRRNVPWEFLHSPWNQETSHRGTIHVWWLRDTVFTISAVQRHRLRRAGTHVNRKVQRSPIRETAG